MRVAVVHSGGRYAERVVATLRSRKAGEVAAHEIGGELPLIIDEPESYLPAALGEAEVIIAIHLHQDLLVEIPHLVQGQETRALIVPIEDPDWVRPGLARQVGELCDAAGIEAAFCKPFCALQPPGPVVAEFCRRYKVGRPEFKITRRQGNIAAVEVVRGSACGLSDFVARRLLRLAPGEDPVEATKVLHHTYPCFASMRLDETRGDTLMHLSVDIQKEAISKALENKSSGKDAS